ncbi:putative bifunctional diguanylate cyclase/phosphodiesterase [Methylopila musalis]|uniref:Bifunctional diguanylate cyclase/phosphodiesterase n=1 Tax=Methylopila musalis TaxID=1134781 RepID=A0ABW3Z560_9HYPH
MAAGFDIGLLATLAVPSLIGAFFWAGFARAGAHAETASTRVLWIALAAVVGAAFITLVGASFVSAVGAPVSAVYDLRVMALAFVAAATLLAVSSAIVPDRRRADMFSMVLGGVVVGLAFAASHYVALFSVRLSGRLLIDDGMLATAIAAVAAGAGASFAIAGHSERSRTLPLGLAVFTAGGIAFHMLLLDGVTVASDPRVPLPNDGVSGDQLLLVSLGFLSVALILALVGVLVEARFGAGGVSRQARLETFADLSSEGIVICEDLRVVDVNVAAARMIGLDPSTIRGRAFRDFVDAPNPDRVLSASLAKPQEITIRSMGGALSTVELASRDMMVLSRPRRVFNLRDISEQKRTESRIRHLAYHDPLTGLANRAAFNEALAAAMRRGGEVALFCIDLDKFKEINDVFGHSAGDEVLRIAAQRITGAAPGVMVFRLGGDEFVAIGTGADAGDADKLARRIVERLNTEAMVAGKLVSCGGSVGYAIAPHHGATTDTLFANADAALYRAKADGRGLARGFEAGMDLALRERWAMQQDLSTAISRNEMFLHWMPQANTETGEIVGFEALLRWKHPERGVVPPAQFIPAAEQNASIVPIGEWVLRAACREAARWPKACKVAVNLSPVQFQHGDIVALVHEILLETGLSPARLEIEITEGVLLDDHAAALNTLRRFKTLGVQIALDDFGTGYSSLSYLQSFPFDRLKIDASFIKALATSPQAQAIVRSVLALGESLRLPITAEGVETQEQRAFLAELRCDEIQGYLVGRPSPVVSFQSLFEKPQRLLA